LNAIRPAIQTRPKISSLGEKKKPRKIVSASDRISTRVRSFLGQAADFERLMCPLRLAKTDRTKEFVDPASS
jgi:hypothetical protein